MNKNELKAIFIVSWHWLSNDLLSNDDWAVNWKWDRERDINNVISSKTVEILKNSNLFWVEIVPIWINTRLSLLQKIKVINDYCDDKWLNHKNSILISVHQNAFSDSSANWVECWFYENSNVSNILAKSITDSVSSITSLKNRWAKDEKDNRHWRLWIVHYTKPLAVLIECWFITNTNDLAILKHKYNLISIWIVKWVWNYIWFDIIINDDITNNKDIKVQMRRELDSFYEKMWNLINKIK